MVKMKQLTKVTTLVMVAALIILRSEVSEYFEVFKTTVAGLYTNNIPRPQQSSDVLNLSNNSNLPDGDFNQDSINNFSKNKQLFLNEIVPQLSQNRIENSGNLIKENTTEMLRHADLLDESSLQDKTASIEIKAAKVETDQHEEEIISIPKTIKKPEKPAPKKPPATKKPASASTKTAEKKPIVLAKLTSRKNDRKSLSTTPNRTIIEIYDENEMVIFVNSKNIQSISISDIKNMYNDTMTSWPNGSKIKLYNLPINSPARSIFSNTILNQSPWVAARAVSNRAVKNMIQNPMEIKTARLIAHTVSKSTNAIGYAPYKSVKGNNKIRIIFPNN